MELLFSPRGRAERLIAGGRVVLAASSLFAVGRDPSEPAKYVSAAYGLLVAYVVYAALIALAVWRMRSPSRLQGWLTHSFDLAFFSAFMYFTSGPASPFIAYFVFALVCATLRWQWRGALWTAVASLAAFVGLGYYFAEVLRDPTFELNEFIIRGFYMGVVAFLLGYLGVHEQRTRREISLLAAWPQATSQVVDQLVAEQLSYVAQVLGAPAVMLAWQRADGQSPLLYATWRSGSLTLRTAANDSVAELVAGEVANCGFLTSGSRAKDRDTLLRDASGSLLRWRGEPLSPALATTLGGDSVLSLPVRGELAVGRLFALGKTDASSDDLLLGEVCAAVVTGRLDHLLLVERLQQAAASEERIRLARDLHDGVLQSFTGFGLRVAAIRRLLTERPGDAEQRLHELQRLVAVEQRDLRFLIQELEPGSPADGEGFLLENRLADLLARVEQEWQLSVTLETSRLPEELSDEAARDVYNIIREALVNAVRHGDATRVEIRLAGEAPGRLAISVVDNGHGFPFEGRYLDHQLAAMKIGPRTLRERVVARGGSLELESSAAGARLEIAVPV